MGNNKKYISNKKRYRAKQLSFTPIFLSLYPVNNTSFFSSNNVINLNKELIFKQPRAATLQKINSSMVV